MGLKWEGRHTLSVCTKHGLDSIQRLNGQGISQIKSTINNANHLAPLRGSTRARFLSAKEAEPFMLGFLPYLAGCLAHMGMKHLRPRSKENQAGANVLRHCNRFPVCRGNLRMHAAT